MMRDVDTEFEFWQLVENRPYQGMEMRKKCHRNKKINQEIEYDWDQLIRR